MFLDRFYNTVHTDKNTQKNTILKYTHFFNILFLKITFSFILKRNYTQHAT